MPALPAAPDGTPASRLCLGTAPFGTRIDERDSFALLNRYVETGGNFLDTARIYSDWVVGEKRRSERILGDWLHARKNRDRLVIATKGAHPFMESLGVPRSSAAEIRDDLEGSLRTLRVDVVDFYWLHRDDPRQPVDHFIDLLNTFVREGKIRAFGASNWSTARIRAANAYATSRGLHGFSANQPLWCLGSDTAQPPKDPTLVRCDAVMREFHRETQLPVIPYTSQANGFFSKLIATGRAPKASELIDFDTPANHAIARVVAKIATTRGIAPSAVVLAYLWSHRFPVHPIIGCRTLAQLDESIAALPVQLTNEELAALETRN
ncbi:aldo/keto reductase [Oleiharenicola lentus]|uniref:aldo/keto reductase n=1 Tax=Oleiharenicola lentus TaxID=2508720 RepID=UPI003F671233